MKERFWSTVRSHRAGCPFNIIIGGRAGGKTYGTLSEAYNTYLHGDDVWKIPVGMRFIYMRRTEVEVQSISDEKYNPFKTLNRDKGWNIQSAYQKKNGIGTFTVPGEDGEDELIGYASALSVFGNLRGADLSDVGLFIFDEFMKAKNKMSMKGEADAFFNAYETINRNREIEGRPPLYVYLLSNSTDINSPLLAELGLISVIEHMKRKGQHFFTDKNRGIHMEVFKRDDFTIFNERDNCALAKLTRGTDFYSHAYDNEFSYNDFDLIEYQNIKDYLGYLRIRGRTEAQDVYVYKHKSINLFYACTSRTYCPACADSANQKAIRRRYGPTLIVSFHGAKMLFSDYNTKRRFMEYFEIKEVSKK